MAQELWAYCKLRWWNEDQTTAAFPLYLKDSAVMWYDAVPEAIQKKYADLKKMFMDRFMPTSINSWMESGIFLNTKQGPNQNAKKSKRTRVYADTEGEEFSDDGCYFEPPRKRRAYDTPSHVDSDDNVVDLLDVGEREEGELRAAAEITYAHHIMLNVQIFSFIIFIPTLSFL